MANENYSEKVSVNINTSTLSNIDILVDNGYYSNRSDFINQALREKLQKHQSTLERIIEKQMEKGSNNPNRWFVGISSLGDYELKQAEEKGLSLTYTGYGILTIDKDMDEELLFRVVKSITVKGKVISSQTIKDHYGLK
jgi:Arc/MetJ-type ribon-helix-helix transcriptional regulator